MIIKFQWFIALILAPMVVADHRSCFKRVIRRSIGNTAPIAEYRRIALSACVDNCIMAAGNGPQGGSICQAFTYQLEKQLCKLFDNDGHKVPAVIHPIMGVDIFYRTSDTGECGGPISDQKTNPNFVKLGNRSNNDNKVAEADLPTITNDQFTEKAKMLSSPLMKMQNLDEVLRSKLHGEDPLVPMSSKDSRENEDLEKNASLKCSTSSGYYVVVGNEIVLPISGGDVKVYNEVEQGACAKYCSENKGPDGVLINCRSLNYFPMDRKCELYGILAEPHGTGKLLENEKVIYAEKFCLPESSYTCQDDEIFILHVQKTVKKRKIASKSANSITDCLRRCLDNERCKSSVFVSGKKKCEMFDVDVSNSDYLHDSDQESVLIENGCRRNGMTPKKSSTKQMKSNKPKTSAEADGWSGCDYKIKGETVRVRTNDDGELETEEC